MAARSCEQGIARGDSDRWLIPLLPLLESSLEANSTIHVVRLRVDAMIKVNCPGCGKTIKAQDEWAGKQGKCPGCGSPITIPGATPKNESMQLAAITPKSSKATAAAAPAAIAPLALPPSRTADFIDDQLHGRVDEYQHCPFCGEKILRRAIKCRFCNEFFDGRDSRPGTSQQINITPAAQPAIHVNVTQPAYRHPKWSPGVAMALSFFIPGMGQIYKGQLLNGLAWLVCTVIGYMLLIFPGLVIHICCVVGAGSGDPYH
jgi:predicted RNA-binding Zn-ribbon protein involved in translation (DUF1610 family)